jgi:hypothetical protein
LQARDSACPWFGVSDSEESRDALYEALRAAAETNMITLAGLAPGEDSEDYLAQAARSLRAYVQRSQAAPSREPRKGGRPRGQPNRLKDDEEAADERYKRRVVLCNLWRQTPTEYRDRRDLWSGSPTKTWSEFLDLVNRSRLLSKSYTSQKTLERATIDALKWGAPLPGFLDLDRFVLG